MTFKPMTVALACAGLLSGLSAAGGAAAQTVVKIGHVAPLTGGNAALGRDNELGAKLAIEDLNARKLKIGGQEVRFELLSEDDASDPKQGTAVAQKLVDAKVNGVIGHLNSSTTIPAAKIYSDAGIPQISPSATNPDYTHKGYKTAFRVVANDGQLGSALGKYAVKEVKAKSIAVIDDRTAYGKGVADEFEKAAKAAGAKIVGARQATSDKTTDFMSILTTIKGRKPDLIFYGGMGAQAGPMLRQMKQLGINASFMGGDGICSEVELPQLAGDAIGESKVVCAEAGGVTPDKAAGVEAWRKRFKEKFNADVQLYAPYVYDATMVMASAMQKANSVEPAKYLPELAKISYDGVTGKVQFDARGDMKDGVLTLYTYKGGKRSLLMVSK